jgi:hypothetical protein
MTDIRIPTHWKPDVAMSVLDFLDEIYRAIWELYQRQLIPILIADLHAPDLDDPDFDGPDFDE